MRAALKHRAISAGGSGPSTMVQHLEGGPAQAFRLAAGRRGAAGDRQRELARPLWQAVSMISASVAATSQALNDWHNRSEINSSLAKAKTSVSCGDQRDLNARRNRAQFRLTLEAEPVTAQSIHICLR